MLASIKADTSGIEKKLGALLEMFPEGIPDEFAGVVSGLTDNVVLVNSATTVVTGGAFDVVCVLDFDCAFYDKVLSAARAFKADFITH
ncbi:hypothetical protein [Pantoea sp. BAV 3049]|uniref:hypothetical protein n=1 Tax=Pantoea sp. BAV 3049 TaxID=2654188 RepID=UPI00131BAA88|nr:hypothetical protein [Pantoea sp. BAV 3049]